MFYLMMYPTHFSITWLHHGNRPPGMLSIWMACEARRSKTTHGDGGVVIAKDAWWEELEERWRLFCDDFL